MRREDFVAVLPHPARPRVRAGAQALPALPPDRILVSQDCRHRRVPADAARATLRAMTTAAAAVRGRLHKEKKDT